MLQELGKPRLKLELSTAAFHPSKKSHLDQILIPQRATSVIEKKIHTFSEMLIKAGIFRDEDILCSFHLARGLDTDAAKDELADVERGSIDIPDIKTHWKTAKDIVAATVGKRENSSIKTRVVEISNHVGWDVLSMGSETQLKKELQKLILPNQRSVFRINELTLAQHDTFFANLLKEYPLLDLAVEIDADNHTFSDYLEFIDTFAQKYYMHGRVKISFDLAHHARTKALHPNNQVPTWPEQLAFVLSNRKNQYYNMDINPYHEGQQTHHDFLFGLLQYKLAMTILGRALYIGNNVSTIIVPEFHPREVDKILDLDGLITFKAMRRAFEKARDGV